MNLASKTAELAGSAVSNAAWQGGSMSNPITEMTMATHITSRPPGATQDMTQVANDLAADEVVLTVFEDRTRPLNPGEPIKFSTRVLKYRGENVVEVITSGRNDRAPTSVLVEA